MIKKLIFLLLLSGLPILAIAETPLELSGDQLLSKELLQDKAAFNEAIFFWDYEFDDKSLFEIDPEYKNNAVNFVKDTVYDGLKTIEKINPKLTYSIAVRLFTTDLTWSFRQVHGENNFAAYYMEVLGIRKIVLADVARWIAKVNKNSLDGKLSHYKLLLKTAKNGVFHEFLHFLKAGNNPVSEHNNPLQLRKKASNCSDLNGANNIETDVVYACSAQAFPSKVIVADPSTGNGSMFSPGFYFNTQLSCVTCALAKYKHHHVKSNVEIKCTDESFKKALEFCTPEKNYQLSAREMSDYIVNINEINFMMIFSKYLND